MYTTIETLENIYKKNESSFNTVIILGYSLLILALLDHSYFIAGTIVFYIPTAVYIFFNYKQLWAMLDHWWKILLSFGVLYFLCQMFAEKSLNYGFDIESQYLNYSPFIYAFFVAIVTGSLILFLVHFIRHSALLMAYGFAAYFSSKYRQKTQSLHFNFKFFVLLGLMTPTIALSSIEKYVVRYSILADTYRVSDCGAKIDGIWYIRKNQSQCYAIQFSSLFTLPEYQTIASPGK